MLVLTRLEGEVITIGPPGPDQIRVMVTEIRCAGGRKPRVRIGITAPKDVPIMRAELGEKGGGHETMESV